MKTNGDDYVEFLTIRDHFAAMALQAIATKYGEDTYPDSATKLAVTLADTLINELNKEI